MNKKILAIGSGFAGILVGFFGNKLLHKKGFSNSGDKVYKFRGYYNLLNRWLLVKHEGKQLCDYFHAQGYSKIGIYGFGGIGERLAEELENSDIQIQYILDKNPETILSDYPVLSFNDDLEQADVIVVTAIFAFDEIKRELSKMTKVPILSLEDVVFEL